ncbi:MAG: 16S rRNA (cytosine(1402)-N(4))-methyltransferase RsmH [Patescibacteria group bacterium]|nr:16S rRNA (cytosine(1402)-N(4))-methyltransferase RsmH [Patescibacteria group bacterium]
MAEIKHIPVLLNEVIGFIKEDTGLVVDATVGFGGHAESILMKFPKIKVIGIDQDKEALDFTKERLEKFRERVQFEKGNFRNLSEILTSLGIKKGTLDFIIADLGISSVQVDRPERGFSFKKGPLDMRMDQSLKLTAGEIINERKEKELVRIFKEYGEEIFAKKIAKRIIERRKEKEIETTEELREIIISVLPKSYIRKLKIDPATKVFQALRIAVNDELNALKEFLPQALESLKVGGRLGVISFHSLEDRIVKNYMRIESKDCICPKEKIICDCKHIKRLKILTKKPLIPSEKELKQNPRSRSAKLRVAEKY